MYWPEATDLVMLSARAVKNSCARHSQAAAEQWLSGAEYLWLSTSMTTLCALSLLSAIMSVNLVDSTRKINFDVRALRWWQMNIACRSLRLQKPVPQFQATHLVVFSSPTLQEVHGI